jgi:hypothetical protein
MLKRPGPEGAEDAEKSVIAKLAKGHEIAEAGWPRRGSASFASLRALR